ncbi:hypothetical protein M434DRAFT_287586 [Hypoxylon sp. CO27-5]|nr:hypothetical protein M434DRAFT_287586 [Hypoxylon sp. CO27-5]
MIRVLTAMEIRWMDCSSINNLTPSSAAGRNLLIYAVSDLSECSSSKVLSHRAQRMYFFSALTANSVLFTCILLLLVVFFLLSEKTQADPLD